MSNLLIHTIAFLLTLGTVTLILWLAVTLKIMGN